VPVVFIGDFLESARSKILSGQIELIDRFEKVGL
jgi:hypothetical protein